MNILIRKLWDGNLLAMIRISPTEIASGEGRVLGEAIGNLVLAAAARFDSPIQSIKWDMTHQYTKHYVTVQLIKDTIYERPNQA